MSTPLIVTREQVQDGILPIAHLSYSAMRQYMTSENLFYKRYIRFEFEQTEQPSMMIGKAAHETIERFWQDKHLFTKAFGQPDPTKEDYIDHAQTVFSRMLREAREKAVERLGYTRTPRPEGEDTTPETEWTNENGELINDEISNKNIEQEAINWGVKVNEEEARKQLSIAITNYIDNADNSMTISTEIQEVVEFTDLEGNQMPLPLKGIIDRIEKHPEYGEGLRDYKIVSSFSNTEEEDNSGYMIQAGAFYFIYQGINGKPPKYAMFEEVLKKEPGYIVPAEPERKLLQADLRELCDTHGITWEKYDKNEQLKEKLVLGGVLVKEPGVKRIVFNYEEKPEIISLFLELYKRILNKIAFKALFDIPDDIIPNPFDQMSGKDSWKDFTEGVSEERDSTKKVEKQEKSSDFEDFEY